MVTPAEPGAFDADLAAQFGAGRSGLRIEDERLLTGQGRFIGDRPVAGELAAILVRSPHAHAEIRAINIAPARHLPGVVAIYTGADLARDGIGPFGHAAVIERPGGGPLAAPPRLPLAVGIVRHVGDPVVLVIALTPDQARDAAEAIEIDYDPRPAVIDLRAAVAPLAPVLWPEAPANVAGLYEAGDCQAVDAAMVQARHVVRLSVANNRVIANPLEPRGAVGLYDEASGRYTLHACSQAPHLARQILAQNVLGIAEDRLRILVGDMGGGFGARIAPGPEEALVLYAARKLGRPVRWQAERGELFLTEGHGRDHWSDCELALDGEGRILALRLHVLANMGAYLSFFGAAIATRTGNRIATGVYRIPAFHLVVRCVLTNIVPTGPYRGAGRPEAIHRLERLMDVAAAETGIDPVVLRRRNLVPRAAMPYRTAMGETYDSGDFERALNHVLAAADWDGFESRRAAAARRGKLRGRGVACHIDTTSGMAPTESVVVEAAAEGGITVYSGTQAMGQGLASVYAHMVAHRLGLPLAMVEIVQGDTDRVASGVGSYGSRSLFVGGAAIAHGTQSLLDAARALAATRLEAAEIDLDYADGWFRVAGTDRAVRLFDLARDLPARRIVAAGQATAPFCFPNGACVCEVEIDRETGAVAIVRLVTADDIGTILHPAIVEGQVHGGLAQGAAQALLDSCRFDAGSGQLLSGSLMDYCLPRADDFPFFETSLIEGSPAATNPLGAKGAGECGVVGTPPAVVAAVVDGLRDYGVRHLDMPIRSETVWRILAAGAGSARASV